MFSSRDNLQAREIGLLSNRFGNGSTWMRKKLSASQQNYFDRLQRLADEGKLWFVHGPCPCDRGAMDTVIARRDRYGIQVNSVLCHDCGTVRLDPYFDEKSLGIFYSDIYQELYGRSQDPVEYLARQRVYGEKVLQNFESWLNPAHCKVLEIGCGAGGAIRVFQEKGFKAFGCDYSRELIEFGASQGIRNLTCGTVDSIGLPKSEGDKFDLIYLHHVLEHVGQPFVALQSMQHLLKSDGRILIIVPDLFRVETHRKAPNDCMELFHIAHKWNFTRECFSYFASKLGMHAIDVQSVGPRTAWSEATEFWVLFQKQQSDCALTGPSRGGGLHYLDYLRSAEQKFAASLIAVAPTASPSIQVTVTK